MKKHMLFTLLVAASLSFNTYATEKTVSTVVTWKATAVKQTGVTTTNEHGDLVVDGKPIVKEENNFSNTSRKTQKKTQVTKQTIRHNDQVALSDVKEEKTETLFFWK